MTEEQTCPLCNMTATRVLHAACEKLKCEGVDCGEIENDFKAGKLTVEEYVDKVFDIIEKEADQGKKEAAVKVIEEFVTSGG